MEVLGRAHAIARWSCWCLLHLLYCWITDCVSFFFYLKRSLCSPPSYAFRKLPRHLGLLIDSNDVALHVSKIAMLLQQLSQLGIRHVSIYDAEGVSKAVLPGALKGNSVLQFYSRTSVANDAESISYGGPCEQKDRLLIELLCIRDGKQAIVEAARNICLKSLQSGASSNLREDDIDLSLKEIAAPGPDPDSLLLFSNSRCLQGYPPWRLRLTEIQHLGPIQGISKQTIFIALDEYSHKHHRYGK